MFLNSKGIILRTVKYSESSLILDMYTEVRGRKSFIISGIRSKQAKTKAGLLQVLGLVDFVSYDKDTTALNRIKEIKADHLYKRIPFEVLRSGLGMFVIEVCAKSILESEANPQLYNYIRSTLIKLDKVESSELSLYHIEFLVGLSQYLGFGIENNYSTNNGCFDLRQGTFSAHDLGYEYSLNNEVSEALHKIMLDSKVKIHKTLRDQLLNQLLLYYQYHVENFGKIKSLEVLRSIFS